MDAGSRQFEGADKCEVGVQLYPGPWIRSVRPAVTSVMAGRFCVGRPGRRTKVPSNNPKVLDRCKVKVVSDGRIAPVPPPVKWTVPV